MSNSSGAAADEVVERRPQGQDGRTVRVVSGRGYRYVLPFPYKLQYVTTILDVHTLC